jgi:DNA-directed RNA polymerase subunit RPC12/RpoP
MTELDLREEKLRAEEKLKSLHLQAAEVLSAFYVPDKVAFCPYCGSPKIIISSLLGGEDFLEVKYYCQTCGRKFIVKEAK